jgi:hypothetical protein
MTDAAIKSQGHRTLADSFMRDAQREATPWRSRADLAFEAVYLAFHKFPNVVDSHAQGVNGRVFSDDLRQGLVHCVT